MSAKKLIPIADQQVRAQPVEQPGRKRRFTPPSAYTILVALIVLMTIATLLVPAGVHDRDAIDVALFIIVIGGFLAAPSATASSTRLVVLLVGLAVGIFVVLATSTGSTGTRRGRWSTT